MFGQNMSRDDLRRVYDAIVVDQNGDKVGGVGQLYLDDSSDRPSWVTAKTGLFGTKETFVPLAEAEFVESEIRVPYTKDFIKSAPNVDAEHHLSAEEEDELYRYYHIDQSQGAAAGVGRDDADPDRGADGGADRGAGVDPDRGADGGADRGAGVDPDRGADGGADRGAGVDPDRGADGGADRGAGVDPDRGADGGADRGAGVDPDHGADGGADRGAGVDPDHGADGGADRGAGIAGGGRGESGRGRGARLRRHTVTEEQTITVPVQREQVEIVDDEGDGRGERDDVGRDDRR